MADAQFRVGHTIPEFGGIDRDHDPAAIPVHRFRDLINVRLQGKLVCRGGQEKLNPNDQLVGCSTGIFGSEYQFGPDVQIAGHLLTVPDMSVLTPSGTAGGDGSTLGEALQINLPDVSRIPLDPERLLNFTCCAQLGTAILVGAVDSSGAIPACTLRGLAPPALATFPDDVLVLTSMAVIGTSAYIGALAQPDPEVSATVLRVYKWDGTTLTMDNEFAGGTDFLTLAVYNNSELIASVHTPPALWRRSDVGVWSQPALPAGVTDFRMNSSVTFGLKVYLGGTGTGATPPTSKGHILSWDGAVFALEREIMYLTPPYDGNTVYNVGAMTVSAGVMYYGNTGGVREGIWVGTYDGVTWSDQATRIAAPTLLNNPFVGFLYPAFISLFWDSVGIIHAVFATSDQDAGGGWLSVLSNDLAGFATTARWTLDYGPLDLEAGAFQGYRSGFFTEQKPVRVG